ncbi:hypothetical protein F4679DRAFT_590245 [Xylaria curta]|nr:hypothetical protein F4679DRAFT_590245 [Xylaria curta]
MPTKKSPTRTPLPTLTARHDAQGNEDEEDSRDIGESSITPKSSGVSPPTMENTPPKSPDENLEANDNGSPDNNKDVNTVVNNVNGDSRISPPPSCNGPSSKRKRSVDIANHSELALKELQELSRFDKKPASPQTETKTLFALHPSKTKGMKLLPHPLPQDPSESETKRLTTASSSTPENPPPQKRRKRGRPSQDAKCRGEEAEEIIVEGG